MLEATEEENQKRSREIARLERELGRADQRIDEFLDALGDRLLPKDVISAKIQAEQHRKVQLQSELERLKQEVPVFPDSLDSFREELSAALDEPETRKAAFHGLIRQVTVHPDAALELEYVIKLTNNEVALRGNRFGVNSQKLHEHWAPVV